MRPLIYVIAMAVLSIPAVSRTAIASGLYSPAQSDFRSLYEADNRNKNVQTWDDYWDWVQTFYKGGLCAPGWTVTAQDLESPIASQDNRSALEIELNSLGKEIAGEWAKDNNHRRVDTVDLQRWYDDISTAQRMGPARVAGLLATLKKIHSEVHRKLHRQS